MLLSPSKKSKLRKTSPSDGELLRPVRLRYSPSAFIACLFIAMAALKSVSKISFRLTLA
jgi:hypothetical protein